MRNDLIFAMWFTFCYLHFIHKVIYFCHKTNGVAFATSERGNEMELEKTTKSVKVKEPALKKKKAKKFKYNHWALTLMVLPAVIHVFIFNYLPMSGLLIAFKDYRPRRGIFGSEWTGIKNFEFLIKGGDFFLQVRNTIGYNLMFIICGMMCAIIVAVMLDTINKRIFVKLYQVTMFLPYFLSWIVVSYVTNALFHPTYGMFEHIAAALGSGPLNFYTETKYWPFIFVIATIWKGVGNQSLIYYGTIMGISPELYESASLDGCGFFGKFRYITLPHLKSTMIILGIMAIGGIFRSDYGLFMFLPKAQTSTHLKPVIETLDTYIFRSITDGSAALGKTAAAGFLQSIVGFITVVRKIEPENAMF